MPKNSIKTNTSQSFIDLFAGCGGFSVGLGRAEWKGIFAIEKDSMAFKTFKHNLLDGAFQHYSWPQWLPKEATTVQSLLKNYSEELESLRGRVDLLAGGPPCQGFSIAGQRNSRDPRNKLSQHYVKVVSLVRPKLLIIENVRGFNSVFSRCSSSSSKVPYSSVVKKKLEDIGYTVFQNYVHCERFGVAQLRTRFIMIGVLNEIFFQKEQSPFDLLEETRKSFLDTKGLPDRPVTVEEAINDLETCCRGAKLIMHSGSEKHCFKQLDYKVPETLNAYQSAMRRGLNGQIPNSLRLAKHRPSTVSRFKMIQDICSNGGKLSKSDREALGIKKQVLNVLDANKASNTLTTLPDDLLHYSEPRILTVRESARIQSFPDNFAFKGKYSTGGHLRAKECPRYTQVGNAIPPLLAEALGVVLKDYLIDEKV
ncbi:MAG: DNA cytosine methyltransferase [Candidatus Electryonea clarkiae]|nr:DNA cytosine methyltransferase [Candidatus Electryonea clarkiae]MDP8285148.1 DNA cytosine methyltransferase [Candidatus Electryonea clarkiae]